jgi:hypothetical protein
MGSGARGALEVLRCPCCGRPRRIVGADSGGPRLRELLERVGLATAPPGRPGASLVRAAVTVRRENPHTILKPITGQFS